MLKAQIKAAFRSILYQKYYSLLNILGLAVGLAAFTLIALFVRHELSYDKHNKEANSIYRIVRNEYTCSPPPMAPAIKADIPEIKYASRFIVSNNVLTSVGDKFYSEDEYIWTDNEFFKIFTIDFIKGNANTALTKPNDIVISETMAKKYFGSSDPMGELITFSREHEYSVAGVFKDLPGNSHYQFDIVLPIDSYFKITGNNPQSWSSNYTYSYVKLHADASLAAANGKLVNLEKALTGWTAESGEAYQQHFFFQPISEIHLYSHRQQELQVNGNIRNVYIFSSIGLLILIIAGINYVNLTTAMAGKRYKEVGVRKALGARKTQLINQFLSESLLIALMATTIASGIVLYTQAYFGQLMQRQMALGLADIPMLLPALFFMAILVGLAAGIIPSRSVSGVNVISILRGSSAGSGGGKTMRNSLVLVQFTIALVLIILSINVQRQLAFVIEKDPGYEREQIITMRLFDKSIGSNIATIKQELLGQQDVLAVSSSQFLPHDISGFRRPDWFCENPTDCAPISYAEVDYGFKDLYNLEITSGRNFSKDFPADKLGAFLINEKAAQKAGWESPIGMEISHYDGTNGKIVGVVKDFHFQSMHADIAPLYLILKEDVATYFSIKIASSEVPTTLAGIEATFNDYSPSAPFHYSFLDEAFEAAYHAEKRLGAIFTFFSVVAILLGCLGLYGMSTFIISQCTKEIGVRKVLGASSSGISILLGSKFLRPVVFANLIAWPLAYFSLNKWLEGFAYKTDITVWSFALAALLVLAITILTVSLQSRKIAKQTPSVSLRYE